MIDARAERARAASTLARARWGHTRTDRLVAELRERRAELVTEQVDVLRELVDEADHNDEGPEAA